MQRQDQQLHFYPSLLHLSSTLTHTNLAKGCQQAVFLLPLFVTTPGLQFTMQTEVT